MRGRYWPRSPKGPFAPPEAELVERGLFWRDAVADFPLGSPRGARVPRCRAEAQARPVTRQALPDRPPDATQNKCHRDWRDVRGPLKLPDQPRRPRRLELPRTSLLRVIRKIWGSGYLSSSTTRFPKLEGGSSLSICLGCPLKSTWRRMYPAR